MIDFVVHDRLAYFSGATAPFTPFLPPFYIRAIVHLTIADVSEHDSSFSVHKKFSVDRDRKVDPQQQKQFSVYMPLYLCLHAPATRVGSCFGCCAATGEQSLLGAKYRLDAALD